MSHQVSLHQYSDEYQEALAAFELPEEQARFTALPMEVLVNHKNIPARQLYEKAGFQDTGRRRAGQIGEQFIYTLSV